MGYDLIGALFQFVNLQAALVGVIAVQVYKYLSPSPPPGGRSMETVKGSIWERILPFVGPISALVTCLILELGLPHPPDNVARVTAQDIVRGLLSGLASDFMLRIYYKTIVGV